MSRYYNINGKEYPSVTTILSVISKPGLTSWKVKLGKEESEKVSKEAAGIGSQVHKALEYVIKGKAVPRDLLSKPVKKAIVYFTEWCRRVVFEPQGSEMTVYSDKYGFAGTLDLPGLMGDSLAIIDFKTSGRIYKEVWLQLAAYWLAYTEMTGNEPKRLIVMRFNKKEKGKSEVKEISDINMIKEYADLFLNALALWRFVNGKKWEHNDLKEDEITNVNHWKQHQAWGITE